MNHFVYIVARNNQSFQDVRTILSLTQVILGTTDSYVMTMLYEILNTFLQAQCTWTTFHQGDIVHGERTLKGGHLKQLIQDNIGIRIALYVNYDTHTLTASFVVGIGNTVNLTFLHEFGNILNELLLIYAVRNFGNDDSISMFITFYLCLCAHHNTSSTRLISILHALQTIYICTCGEVGSGNKAHQSFGVDVGIVDISTTTIDNFTQIMRRHIGCHTHGNTVSTINEQVGNLGRHHTWFGERVIEVVNHVYRILLQVVHDLLSHLGESALRITHSSGRVAID